MNKNRDLRLLAEEYARRQGLLGMVPVAEKELLHYQILAALDEGGFLDRLVFQGGTSLRLCYGAQRYSEDLDFCGGHGFTTTNMERLASCVKDSLDSHYRVTTKVKPPAASAGLVSSWMVTVDTTVGRRDQPQQHIKIEVAALAPMIRIRCL